MIAFSIIGLVLIAMSAEILRLNRASRTLASVERGYMELEDAAARVASAVDELTFTVLESPIASRRLAFAALKLEQAMDRHADQVAALDPTTRDEMAHEAFFPQFVDDGAAHLRAFLALARDPGWRVPDAREGLRRQMRLEHRLYAARAEGAALRYLRARFAAVSHDLTRAIHLGGGLIVTVLGLSALLIVRPAARDALAHLLALEQARRAAESASRAKDAFLAAMSHELRTPLNGVLGMAAVLEETALDARQRVALGAIRSSGEALLKMIADILAFSQASGELPDAHETSVNVVDLAAEALAEVAAPAREKGLALWLRVDPELPEVIRICRADLAEVLARLLDNAVKFTSAGAVGLELTGRPEGGRLVFSARVCDTGPGVLPERRATMFERFTQGDDSCTRAHGGGGLGLAIAAQRAEAMGGRISYAPRAEGGSVFSFRVEIECVGGAVGSRFASGGSALLVHRSPESLRALAERLRGLGISPHTAQSVEEALPLLDAPPDLALIAPDGLSGVAQLCTRLAARGAPVVLLGQPDEPCPVEPVAILSDPPAPSALKAALRTALAAAPERSSAQARTR